MTDLPPDLAAHRAELERSVQAYLVEIAELQAHVARLERERDTAVSEIKGIDAAVAAYNGTGDLPLMPAAQRAPRRDIKALAAAEIAQTPGWPGMSPDERVRYLCKQLRCKPSQIKEDWVLRGPGLQSGALHSGPNLAGLATTLGG